VFTKETCVKQDMFSERVIII